MRRAAFVVLAGCNQLFDLQATKVDEYPDALPDAARMCPAPGTPPGFTRDLTQAIQQRCNDYTISFASGVAVGTCYLPTPTIVEGREDGALAPIRGLVPPADWIVAQPRLAGEGDMLLVKLQRISTAGFRYSFYARDADGVWTFASDTNITATASSQATQPSLGPERHVVVSESTAGPVVDWVLRGGAWQTAGSYTVGQLGVTYFGAPRLTSDALRMTAYGVGASGKARVLYIDREAPDLRFSPALELDNVPAAVEPMLADDCSRLYFSALNSVFYVEPAPE